MKIGKIGKIGNGFAYYGRSGGAMVKWTPQLDSAHQIGLSTSSKGKLIIVGECVMGGGLKIGKIEKIGNSVACYS